MCQQRKDLLHCTIQRPALSWRHDSRANGMMAASTATKGDLPSAGPVPVAIRYSEHPVHLNSKAAFAQSCPQTRHRSRVSCGLCVICERLISRRRAWQYRTAFPAMDWHPSLSGIQNIWFLNSKQHLRSHVHNNASFACLGAANGRHGMMAASTATQESLPRCTRTRRYQEFRTLDSCFPQAAVRQLYT